MTGGQGDLHPHEREQRHKLVPQPSTSITRLAMFPGRLFMVLESIGILKAGASCTSPVDVHWSASDKHDERIEAQLSLVDLSISVYKLDVASMHLPDLVSAGP